MVTFDLTSIDPQFRQNLTLTRQTQIIDCWFVIICEMNIDYINLCKHLPAFLD